MKFKRTILIVSITLVLFSSFFITDYVRTVNNQSPVFSIPILRLKDGGSIEYFGLGYKVIKYVLIQEDGKKEETYKIGTWLMPFDNPLKAPQNVSDDNSINSGNTSNNTPSNGTSSQLILKTYDTNKYNAFKQNENYLFLVDGGKPLMVEDKWTWWNEAKLYQLDKKTNQRKIIYTGDYIRLDEITNEFIYFHDSKYDQNDMDGSITKEYVFDIENGKLSGRKTNDFEITYKNKTYYDEWSDIGGPVMNVFVRESKQASAKIILENVKWYDIFKNYLVYETPTDINVLNLDTNVKTKVETFAENITEECYSEISDGYLMYNNEEDPDNLGVAFDIETMQKIENVTGLHDTNAFYYIFNEVIYRYNGIERKALYTYTGAQITQGFKGNIHDLSLIDEYIYFTIVTDNTRECHRIKKDGSELEKVIK